MRAAIEETTTRSDGPRRPRRASSAGANARAVLMSPIRLASSIRSRSSASDSSAGDGSITPALATTRSKSPLDRPPARRGRRRRRRRRRRRAPAASASMRSWRRATRVTCAPAAASARAVAAPIPEEAPVTTCGAVHGSTMLRPRPPPSQSSPDPRTRQSHPRGGGRASLEAMAELGDFLRSRRARLQPQDVGLPDYGRRRVPGPAREELRPAGGRERRLLRPARAGPRHPPFRAGAGRDRGALRLDEDEREHLHRARARRGSAPAAGRPGERVAPDVQRLLDRMETSRPWSSGRRMDVLA